MEDQDKTFVSVKEAARMLNVPQSTIYSWLNLVKSSPIQAVRFGGRYRIRKADVDRLKESQK